MRVAAARLRCISQLREQRGEFVEAAMHISNDVEWPALGSFVVPKRLALDRDRIHFLRRSEHIHMPEAFALQLAHRSAHLLRLLPDHVWPEVAIRPVAVPLLANFFRQIKDDRYGEAVKLAREFHVRLP